MNQYIEIERMERIQKLGPIEVRRKDHGPTQIKSVEEIKPHMLVIKRWTPHRRPQRFAINDHPYQDREGRWWVEVQNLDYGWQDKISLADAGVVPYIEGCWHPYNWLENPNKKTE